MCQSEIARTSSHVSQTGHGEVEESNEERLEITINQEDRNIIAQTATPPRTFFKDPKAKGIKKRLGYTPRNKPRRDIGIPGTSTAIIDSTSGSNKDPLKISSDEEENEANEGEIKLSNPEIIECITID